jgi:hypothetical protein
LHKDTGCKLISYTGKTIWCGGATINAVPTFRKAAFCLLPDCLGKRVFGRLRGIHVLARDVPRAAVGEHVLVGRRRVAEVLAADGIAVPVLSLGLPDAFVEHGDPQQLLADCGLDAVGVARAVRERLAQLGRRPGKAA